MVGWRPFKTNSSKRKVKLRNKETNKQTNTNKQTQTHTHKHTHTHTNTHTNTHTHKHLRQNGRNSDWGHLYARDIICMPDKWEYPWFATWDCAFHCVTLSMVDCEYAKEQLLLFLREW